MKKKKAKKVVKKEAAREKYVSVSSVIFEAIESNEWDKNPAKESLVKAVSLAKKANPKSKYNLDHHNWYLSKFRKQKKMKLGTDKLHTESETKTVSKKKKKKVKKK